jgi:hypothetical protein
VFKVTFAWAAYCGARAVGSAFGGAEHELPSFGRATLALSSGVGCWNFPGLLVAAFIEKKPGRDRNFGRCMTLAKLWPARQVGGVPNRQLPSSGVARESFAVSNKTRRASSDCEEPDWAGRRLRVIFMVGPSSE